MEVYTILGMSARPDCHSYNTVWQFKYDHRRSDQKFMWFVTAVLKAAANKDREQQRKERLDEDRKK